MLSLRLFVLFIHVTAVIVALGGSLFSTFALAPVLAEELDGAPRVRVARRVIQRLGVIVLSALAILVVTGIFNVMFVGAIGPLLSLKLLLVAIVISSPFSSTACSGCGYGEYPPMGLTRRWHYKAELVIGFIVGAVLVTFIANKFYAQQETESGAQFSEVDSPSVRLRISLPRRITSLW